MAWIAPIPPSPRHPYERYQVCYRDGKRQRSAGISESQVAQVGQGGDEAAVGG